MKKLFYIIIVLCCTEIEAQNFNAGLSGGFTTSQISGDYLEGFDKLGAKFGAYVSYPLKKNMDLGVEAQFIQKGSKKPYIENSPQTYSFSLNYIELPVYLSYDYKENIAFEAGIAPSLLVSFEELENGYDVLNSQPEDFSLDYLMGLKYHINKFYGLNLRYCNSILPVRSSSLESSDTDNRGQYSSLFSLSFFYQFK